MKHFLYTLVISATLLIASPLAMADVIEGTDYIRLPTPIAEDEGEGKVIVREFFWYGCPHCYILEPQIHNWKKPAVVDFIATPAVLGKQWVAHAYAYYTLEALGHLDEMHPILFDALHNEKQSLFTMDSMADFFADHGVDKKKFLSTFKSFLVDTRVKAAQNLGRKYKLRSVPTITVNGKYMTSPSMAGHRRLFEVVEFLVDLEK